MRSVNFRAGLKELAIVFFGVFLGLMADGWREQRSLVGEKNEALRSIRDDLSADAEFQRDYLERVRASAAAGFALAEALTGPDAWSGESAASRIDALISGRPLVTTGQGYEAAKSRNLLSFVEHAELRRALAEYYEGDQDHFDVVDEVTSRQVV